MSLMEINKKLGNNPFHIIKKKYPLLLSKGSQTCLWMGWGLSKTWGQPLVRP